MIAGNKHPLAGRLIVLDGIDGCGKKTQTGLLVEKLKKEGCKVKSIDFPRYYDNFFGKFIGECLAGKHGDFVKLSPKIASVLYAADRFESAKQIKGWLDKGYTVVTDRYVSANQIHQGGKIADSSQRRKFLQWLQQMEFEIFQIPQPDVVIFLKVPVKVAQSLLNNNQHSKKRYNHGKKDAHEKDVNHLQNAHRSALSLLRENNNWLSVTCAPQGKMLSKEKIATLVWEGLEEFFGF